MMKKLNNDIYYSEQEKQLFLGANLPSTGTGGSKEYPFDKILLFLSNINCCANFLKAYSTLSPVLAEVLITSNPVFFF